MVLHEIAVMWVADVALTVVVLVAFVEGWLE
jgi:hypothetical protein